MVATPHLTSNPDALRLLKRPIAVPVTFAKANGTTETLEGPVRHRAGDAVLTGSQGENWPVRRDMFLRSYAPIPPTQPGDDGTYLKRPEPALAIRLRHELEVPVGWQADPLHAQPGDWLLRYADGSHGVIQDQILRATYGPAEDETRWPPVDQR